MYGMRMQISTSTTTLLLRRTSLIYPLIQLWEDGGGEFLIGPLSQRTKEFRPDNFFYHTTFSMQFMTTAMAK
jgi:hypothetical protein